MAHPFHKALIIGKFQPLHKGHLALIDFAARQAETVLVCAAAHPGEHIPLEQRVDWLKESYKNRENIAVQGISYDPARLNPSSVSDLKSSEQWADYLREVLEGFAETDVIVGSELYVKYMADYLGIHYLIYDEPRKKLPISATTIKSDPIRYWDYLSPAAKHTYAKHICICGSESTGKSTTCKTLEQQYPFVTMIPEIGRCLVGKSEICASTTLQKIFSIHHDLLEAVLSDPPTPIVLWDTDNITTLSYFHYLYPEREQNEITQGKKILTAGKYFFFESNIPLEDDGTRLSANEALALRTHHLKQYAEQGIHPDIVTSKERCEVVRRHILSEIEQLKKAFKPQSES